MSTTMDRIGSWAVVEYGIVQFDYARDGRQFVFYVTDCSMQDVIRDIRNMAANPTCELDWHDAEYLSALIREVMAMQAESSEPCDCDMCVARKRNELLWWVVMPMCLGAFWFGVAVFLIWGR